MKNGHVTALEAALEELLQLLEAMPASQLNTVPSYGGWTAAQVGDHLLRSYDVLETLQGHTAPAGRQPDEKVAPLRGIFLDFENKLQAPDFILPTTAPVDKQALVAGLKAASEALVTFLEESEPGLLCLDFELPVLGALTRLEWTHFIETHTRRHIHQLKKIQEDVLSGLPGAAPRF